MRNTEDVRRSVLYGPTFKANPLTELYKTSENQTTSTQQIIVLISVYHLQSLTDLKQNEHEPDDR